VFCLLVRRDGSAGSSPRDCGRLATCRSAWTSHQERTLTSSGSVAERAVVERALSNHGIEAVVHAGALHKPDIARHPGRAFIDVNVTGTLNLLEAAVAAGHDRFVFTSTTSLMVSQDIRQETGSAAVWLDESLGPLAPRNIYGVTKLAAEGLCRLHFPDAPAIYAQHGWRLPTSIGRVYDASRIERVLRFRCATDFGRVLNALRTNGRLPFAHKPAYRS